MATLRKNGQQPSCEPCRTSKLRCDHSKPICQRCVARNRADQCVYHPCPLTKPRDTRQRKEQARSKRHSSTTKSACPVTGTGTYEWVGNAPSVISRISAPKSGYGELLADSAFLSLPAPVEGVSEHSRGLGSQPELSSETTAAPVDTGDLGIGAQILSLFEHLSFFEEVIERRFDVFDGSVYSPHLIRESLVPLKALYHDAVRGASASGRWARLLAWSQTVFQNTAMEIETHSAMTLSAYAALIAPRWDVIGLIFALLGTATFQISQNEAVLKRDGMPGKDKHGLRKIAMAASDMCFQFSHKLGAISDPLLWTAMQRTVFLVEMHGSADYRSWQSLGEVASLTFALGLHQCKIDERAPFFLSEIRCRALVCAYAMDKDISTILARPPRICRRYCNFRFPLDLDWADVVADAPIRDAAIRRLGPDGWDTHDHLGHECSRPRATLLSNILREMILEVSLSCTVDNLEDMVKKIRHESNQMRQRLPDFLQWSLDNTHTPVMAASLHLEFLYSELVLSQAIAKLTGETPDSLIEASRQILTVLLDAIAKQIRAGHVNHLLICDLSYVGLPAAAALSKELLHRSHNSPPLSGEATPFPRSEIIQNLCVFAAHLETFLPNRESDSATFNKGLQSIKSTLGAVLNPPISGGLNNNSSMPLPPVDGVELPSQNTQVAEDAQALDFTAFWEDFEFDWEGDRRVLFS
ncbi:hypothetical protein BJX63DRAFT_395390, partial [Aspergillus granulosus]